MLGKNYTLESLMNKETICITIGMPVYGVEKYIKKSILSVLNQTIDCSIEVLVIDDCGNDRSMDIIRECQVTHPKGKIIKTIRQAHNMGCWAARNRIIEEARGEYIFLLDSDDYISEDCLEKLYKEAIKHHAEAVYGSVKTVNDKGDPINIGQSFLNQPYMVIHEKDGLSRFANSRLHPTFRDYIWNTLIKTEFIKKHHFKFKQAMFCDDMIFSTDMTPLVTDAVLIPDITYYYVIRDNSLSSYQKREVIKLEEIIESFRVYSYLKNKCKELKNKDYFETRCTKGMILMFYAICGALKNKDRITPRLSNYIIKEEIKHPLKLNEILKFKRYRIINLGFYTIGHLPALLSVHLLKQFGKKKRYI